MSQATPENKAQAQAEKQRAAQQLKDRRAGQLEIAMSSASKLEKQLAQIDDVSAKHKALTSHIEGF